MKWLLICWMAVLGLGFAQPPGSRPRRPPPLKKAEISTKWPVQSLVVEGNHIYTSEQVVALAGLTIGQLAGKDEFDGARDRLLASGAFETVGYKFMPGPNHEGYVATFQVTEVEPVYPVRFEALGVASPDIESLLHLKDPLFSPKKLPATKVVLDRYVGWIQDYLAAKGHPEKLIARLNPVGADQFEIVFLPARNYPSVAEVTFDGNRGVPQNVLRDAISGVAVGQPYSEERFRELLNTAVRPRYEARGYIHVKFGSVRTEPVKDVEGLKVFVTVDEGDSFHLGKVAVAGPTPMRPEALLKAGQFHTGEVADFDQIGEGLGRIGKAIVRAGYLDAKVTPERVIDEANKTLDVTVHIDAGPQFTMGTLTIVGLDLNGEYEMKRIWSIKQGKPFNPEYPNEFLNSVRAQALFDNLGETKSEVQRNERDHTADVTLTFGGQASKKKGPSGQLPPN